MWLVRLAFSTVFVALKVSFCILHSCVQCIPNNAIFMVTWSILSNHIHWFSDGISTDGLVWWRDTILILNGSVGGSHSHLFIPPCLHSRGGGFGGNGEWSWSVVLGCSLVHLACYAGCEACCKLLFICRSKYSRNRTEHVNVLTHGLWSQQSKSTCICMYFKTWGCICNDNDMMYYLGDNSFGSGSEISSDWFNEHTHKPIINLFSASPVCVWKVFRNLT